METTQILNEEQMLVLKNKALYFTQANISTDGDANWQTIYQTELNRLVFEESFINERNRLMQQAKKREDVIQELQDQVEQLKRQIR